MKKKGSHRYDMVENSYEERKEDIQTGKMRFYSKPEDPNIKTENIAHDEYGDDFTPLGYGMSRCSTEIPEENDTLDTTETKPYDFRQYKEREMTEEDTNNVSTKEEKIARNIEHSRRSIFI